MVPQKHLHPWVLSIRRSSEIRIVGCASILSISKNKILSQGCSGIIGLLKVSAFFIKTVMRPDIVHHVVHVEQVRDHCVQVSLHSNSGIIGEIEIQRSGTIWRITRKIIIIYVFGSIYIVSSCNGVFISCRAIRIVPSERRIRRIGRIYDQTSVSMSRTDCGKCINHVLICSRRRWRRTS
ncbi:hypothetical protein D3C71_1227200 [compost metagenome]